MTSADYARALNDAAAVASGVRASLMKGRKRRLGQVEEYGAGIADSIAEGILALKPAATGPDFYAVLAQWDRLDAAVNGIVTALPGQMTDAAARLEQARREMRALMQKHAFALAGGK